MHLPLLHIIKTNYVTTNHQDRRVLEFADAVREAIPGCAVHAHSYGRSWVYMPGDHLPMGMVGFDALPKRGGSLGPLGYLIRSPHIQNKQYASSSRNHHYRVVSSLRGGLKIAKEALKPMQPAELGAAVRNQYRENRARHTTEVTSHIRNYRYNLFGSTAYGDINTTLHRELTHLLDTEHAFMDPEFGQNLREYLSLVDAAKERTRAGASLVYYRRRGSDTAVVVVPDTNLETYLYQPGEAVEYTPDAVPELIQHRIAALNILPTDSAGRSEYVDGVGIRITPEVFYVTN